MGFKQNKDKRIKKAEYKERKEEINIYVERKRETGRQGKKG